MLKFAVPSVLARIQLKSRNTSPKLGDALSVISLWATLNSVRSLLLFGIDPLTTVIVWRSSLDPLPNELSPVPDGRSGVVVRLCWDGFATNDSQSTPPWLVKR